MIAVTVYSGLCHSYFPAVAVRTVQNHVFSFLGVEMSVERKGPFPVATNECLNIILASRVTERASHPIISALDSSKERRVMD